MALTSCTADDIRSPAGSRINGDGTAQNGPVHSAIWNMLVDGTLIAQVYRDKDLEEPVSFRGQGAAECEDFVSTVNRYAWKAGKANDPKWIAGFAMSCFAGKALRWSMQLSTDTRGDWNLLSNALFSKYTEDEEDVPPASGIPTPAAAPIAELTRSMSNLSLAPRIGWIKVDTGSNRPYAGGYISRHTGSTGILTTCSDPEFAIQVRWTPQANPHLIEIMNPPIPTFSYLGAAHFSNDKSYTQFGPKSTASASLTYVTAPDTLGRSASLRTDTRTGKPVTGPSRSAVWVVLTDGTVIPVVEDSGYA
ncbi:hypothetical protein FRC05_010773 [Tulasnella sp. 425]|nr:hypothetical protein FRC05_010773 [Tulasnella sp. 425]